MMEQPGRAYVSSWHMASFAVVHKIPTRLETVRLPAIFQWPETAEVGALAAYGPRFTDTWRQRARIAVKILRGTKPADIPVEQPSRFELVVNLKTATAIDYEIPAGLVLRADKVID